MPWKEKKIARAKNTKFMNKTFGKAIMAPAGLWNKFLEEKAEELKNIYHKKYLCHSFMQIKMGLLFLNLIIGY